MALISKDTVDRVKEAADIVEIDLAPTPTCAARAPQMTGAVPVPRRAHAVVLGRPACDKLYHCFGCEAGGDVFRFVQEKEGLDFGEAVECWPTATGWSSSGSEDDPKAEAARRRRARLYELLRADGGVLRALSLGLAEGREGARVPARAGAGGEGAA